MFELATDGERLEVLLKFVRNLIIHSRNTEIFRLEEVLKENQIPLPESASPLPTKEEMKEKIKEVVKEKLSNPETYELKKENLKDDIFYPGRPIKRFRQIPNRKPANFGVKRVLKIPKVVLPSYLRYVKPSPTPESEDKPALDLGKLNPFMKDPNVSTVETEGENEIVYVTGTMGRKPTETKLSKIEINEVINRFSKMAKIPKQNGLFKVVVGNLILTAMISEAVSPKFIIEKMKAPPGAPSPYGINRR